MPSGGSPHRVHLLAAVPQDQDRAVGVQYAVQADRAKQCRREFAMSPAAHDEQVRSLGGAVAPRQPVPGDLRAHGHVGLQAAHLVERRDEGLSRIALDVDPLIADRRQAVRGSSHPAGPRAR